MKKYSFVLFLLCAKLSGMESASCPVEQSFLEPLKEIGCREDISLYQVESPLQTGPSCGYFAFANALRTALFLVGKEDTKNTFPLQFDEGFSSIQQSLKDLILKERMRKLINTSNPSSVRDLMQRHMEEKLNSILDQANKETDIGIMRALLSKTLMHLDPTVSFNDVLSNARSKITWSIDKQQFIDTFKERAQFNSKEACDNPNNSKAYCERCKEISELVCSDWLGSVFGEDFKTDYSFSYDGDVVAKRVIANFDCGMWLDDFELTFLINHFGFNNKDTFSINLVSAKNCFEHNLKSMKELARQGIPQGALKDKIRDYEEVSYGAVSALKKRMKDSADDFVEAFIIRLSSSKPKVEVSNWFLSSFFYRPELSVKSSIEEKDDKGAHWVSLVVCRENGALSYYVADSLGNSLLFNPLILDFIYFLEGRLIGREDSIFFINPAYEQVPEGYLIDDFLSETKVPQGRTDSSKSGNSRSTVTAAQKDKEEVEVSFSSSICETIKRNKTLIAASLVGAGIFAAYKIKQRSVTPNFPTDSEKDSEEKGNEEVGNGDRKETLVQS